jgi:hypothetical protein
VYLAPLLAAALAGCQANFRPGAESLLEAVNTTPTPLELVAMASDQWDANNRFIGVSGLGAETFAGEPVYIKLFEDRLSDPEPPVRAAAARALGLHGEPRHAASLAAALKDKDGRVRLEAARALQRIHNPDVVEALIAAKREPDPARPSAAAESEPDVRAEAAIALGQYPQPRVLEALMIGLDDSDPAVANASLWSLRTLTGQDFGEDRAAWVNWRTRTQDYFAGRGQYQYPYFSRPAKWYEHLPFVPRPPNETPAPPAGMPRG